jgi:ribosomal protein S18 acetylase RimI-like enzyme
MKVHTAVSRSDFDEARALFREYDALLDIDLGFQGIEEELRRCWANMPCPKVLFSSPATRAGKRSDGLACVPSMTGRSKLKRLYVRYEGRRSGAGRALVVEAIRSAGLTGYTDMLPDSLPSVEAAIHLYRSLGFKLIPPYWNNAFRASSTSVGG